MIISEVRYNQAIERLRFDAEFYLLTPEYCDEKLLKKSVTIGDLLLKIVRDPMGYGYDYVQKGIPYYRVDDLHCPFLGDDRTVFISPDNHKKLKKTVLKNGDIVMAVRGSTIGRLGLYWGKDDGGNISPNVIILRPKEKELSAYIVLYLLTKIGKSQIKSIIAGTGQPTITVPYIRSIKIPIPPPSFQQKIESLVKEAYEKRKSADEEYKQAQELLNKILGIEKLELKEEKVFESRFDEIEQTLRFDAEHYQPKYKRVKRFIIKLGYNVKKLKDAVTISNKKINPSDEPTKPFNYIELANINSSTGEIEEVNQIKGHNAPSRARMLVKKGDVLISSLLGSLDNVGLVPEEFDGAVASTGFFVIRAKSISPEFLFLLFKSNLIRLQLEEKTAGAIMSAVPKATFGDLLIPIVPEETQKQISEFVKQSFSLRKEAKELLEKAKKEIEEFIEKK